MPNRFIWLFVDDPESQDFHRNVVREVQDWAASAEERLGAPLTLEVRHAFGSQECQRQQAAELASELQKGAEGLVMLMPVDADAALDLLETLHDPDQRIGAESARQSSGPCFACVLLHQALTPAAAEHCHGQGWRVYSVAADQVKMGRIQAEHVVQLRSQRGKDDFRMLYVTGTEGANATRLRIAGAVELLLESEIAVEARHAEWTGSNAREVLESWRGAGGNLAELDLVAAHCDEIAIAVKEYLVAEGFDDIPVLGMDGTDTLGRPLVDRGKLAATVVQPLGARVALEAYEDLVLGRRPWEELRDACNIRLTPTSHPQMDHIHWTRHRA